MIKAIQHGNVTLQIPSGWDRFQYEALTFERRPFDRWVDQHGHEWREVHIGPKLWRLVRMT